MAAVSAKVLVIGAAHGKLKQVFSRVSAINSKNGPFTFCCLLGDLFNEVTGEDEGLDDLLAGRLSIPLECFFVLGGNALPAKVQERIKQRDGEICTNLIFLGKQGIYTTASGLRIATFGGRFDLDNFTSPQDPGDALEQPFFTASSHAAFLTALAAHPKKAAPGASAAPIDILLTHVWPSGITHHSAKPPVHPDAATFGVPAIADLVAAAKPRYHFASGQSIFYEREPFVWPDSTDVTRFFGLGDFANAEKERWFYAFSISLPAPTTVPSNATVCPIAVSRGVKRSAEEMASESTNFRFEEDGARKKGRTIPPDGYVCRKCHLPGHWVQECRADVGDNNARGKGRGRGKKDKKPKSEITPSECYFCLSNPKVTKHLIVAIGNEAYVTLPVGQLPDTSARNTPVPGGGHLLIIPIAHFPTLHSLPANQSEGILSEIELFRNAIRKCYASFGCDAVSYEVGRLSARGGHAHVQICPVPRALSSRAEQAFVDEGSREGVNFESDPEAALEERPDNYFRADLPDGKKLVHILRAGQETSFNLQFGRVVLSQLLDAPQRVDWRMCALPEQEETADALAFKKAFAQYDPT